MTGLVVDIGGTNTRVALAENGRVLTDTIQRYANAEHEGLTPVLQAYQAETGARPKGAVVDVAGPVSDGTATLTNRDWHFSETEISNCLGAENAWLINDLQAVGHSFDFLPERELVPVHTGAPAANGPALIVNAGTGFNAAVVHDTPSGRIVPPSESGHASLPVTTAEELRLADALRAEHGFASVEEILTGRGLEALYRFVTGGNTSSSREIVKQALAEDPAAKQAVDMFVHFFGRVTGDLALVHMPVKGIWLVGGVARAIAPFLAPTFNKSCRDKGRFSDLAGSFSVHLVTDDYAALIGCAAVLKARQ